MRHAKRGRWRRNNRQTDQRRTRRAESESRLGSRPRLCNGDGFVNFTHDMCLQTTAPVQAKKVPDPGSWRNLKRQSIERNLVASIVCLGTLRAQVASIFQSPQGHDDGVASLPRGALPIRQRDRSSALYSLGAARQVEKAFHLRPRKRQGLSNQGLEMGGRVAAGWGSRGALACFGRRHRMACWRKASASCVPSGRVAAGRDMGSPKAVRMRRMRNHGDGHRGLIKAR